MIPPMPMHFDVPVIGGPLDGLRLPVYVDNGGQLTIAGGALFFDTPELQRRYQYDARTRELRYFVHNGPRERLAEIRAGLM